MTLVRIQTYSNLMQLPVCMCVRVCVCAGVNKTNNCVFYVYFGLIVSVSGICVQRERMEWTNEWKGEWAGITMAGWFDRWIAKQTNNSCYLMMMMTMMMMMVVMMVVVVMTVIPYANFRSALCNLNRVFAYLSRYSSSCKQKKSYVMALVRSPRDQALDWNWIQVNTGCNCAISEKFEF